MSHPLPTAEEIRDWLDRTNRDRFWLASQVGATKGTVDSWFSTRGFPKWAILHISKLMESAHLGDELSAISFTAGEIERIERARVRAGYLSRKEFYRDAIIERAQAILAAQAQPAPIIYKAAEEPTPYRTKEERQDAETRRRLDDDRTAN